MESVQRRMDGGRVRDPASPANCLLSLWDYFKPKLAGNQKLFTALAWL
jgi:hypothetical protein